MQIMKKRFRPKIPTNHPLTGRMIALDTRYDVSTHVLSSLLAPRSPAICGSATFAMLVSRTSMNAARETTTAINQGFIAGLDGSAGREVDSAALTAVLCHRPAS